MHSLLAAILFLFVSATAAEPEPNFDVSEDFGHRGILDLTGFVPEENIDGKELTDIQVPVRKSKPFSIQTLLSKLLLIHFRPRLSQNEAGFGCAAASWSTPFGCPVS